MYSKNNWYKEDGDVTISNSGRFRRQYRQSTNIKLYNMAK